MRRKILYVCESIGGGVRKHLLDVLHHINHSKYEIVVVHSVDRTDPIFMEEMDSLKEKGVKFYALANFVREISPWKDTKALFKLIRLIRDFKPDIVHCHSSKAGGVGRIASYLCRTNKIIYTPHAYMFQNSELNQLKKLVFLFFERVLDKFCNYTINVSEGERDTALQNKVTAPRKSILIYNGITKTNREFAPDQNTFVIGTTARLEPQKDPWTFFHIAKEVVTACDNVKFVYVGDGSMKNEIAQEIKKHQLEEKIILTGFQRNPMAFVQTFDIYLITSLYEGMPYSVLEALNYGLPLVATNVIGNNEVVKDGYNGYLFESRKVEEGVQKIISIMNNPLLAAKFAENSRHLFEMKFQIEHMLSALEVVYDVARPEQVLLDNNRTITSYS
ncbi:glycosyltransferase family 4 protein [Paenibacillus sp. MMS18-CY102]|uniref:glycosyltransferase family 4 protein n=1 Tax=Paenibacillus sp. MMS18-CY102 TaxID=2682849 RepID=UPI001365EFEF|nr:glycosyltransferase family 4 protein [Paenibacillus sp. MMS18-CY102]MWC30430.1 glycosyltransferase [Paenibacillus sp. MMS18-CY102]